MNQIELKENKKYFCAYREGVKIVELHNDDWRNISINDQIEICITSPPYNLHKQYNPLWAKTKLSRKMISINEKWYPDEKEEQQYQNEQILFLREMQKICSSSIFYNHKIRYAWHSRNKHKNKNKIYHPMHWLTEFPIWCEIIWDRCGIGNPTRRYHNQTEKIFQIGIPKKWKNPTGLSNIWRIPPTKNKEHPCSFPPQLAYNCMITTTDIGDFVIDPYMGSGTAGVVAIKNKRRFIGIEKEKRFFDVAVRNIKNVFSARQIALF